MQRCVVSPAQSRVHCVRFKLQLLLLDMLLLLLLKVFIKIYVTKCDTCTGEADTFFATQSTAGQLINCYFATESIS